MATCNISAKILSGYYISKVTSISSEEYEPYEYDLKASQKFCEACMIDFMNITSNPLTLA